MGTHPIFESDFDCLTEMLRISRYLSGLRPKPILIGPIRNATDGLKVTWYQLLGVSEKATAMEIEDAFHRKLTSQDDLIGKTDEAEIDKILEQSVDYMEAYKILSHPS